MHFQPEDITQQPKMSPRIHHILRSNKITCSRTAVGLPKKAERQFIWNHKSSFIRVLPYYSYVLVLKMRNVLRTWCIILRTKYTGVQVQSMRPHAETRLLLPCILWYDTYSYHIRPRAFRHNILVVVYYVYLARNTRGIVIRKTYTAVLTAVLCTENSNSYTTE